jgi:hypothetical protein
VVLDESKYKDKSNTVPKSGFYEHLPKHPTDNFERKVQKIFSKQETVTPTDLKHKLTPYHSKSPHLCDIAKIHKLDVPQRLIVSSIGSPCYALDGFLREILSRSHYGTAGIGTSSAHWVQLSRFLLEDGDRIQSRKNSLK